MGLKSLIAGSEVVERKGDLKVQLEVLPDSTLSEEDIENIVKLASWEVNVNDHIQGYEGNRAVLISRAPVQISGFTYRGIQVSGIGHTPGTFQKKVVEHGKFVPPENRNVLDLVDQNSLCIEVFVNGRYVKERDDFRALGTYTHPELVQKLQNTLLAQSWGLSSFGMTKVEAVGRYLDEGLVNEDGPYGFFVVSVPAGDKERFGPELMKELAHLETHQRRPRFKARVSQVIPSLMKGLREMHDLGYFHLAMHASNYYETEEGIIVADFMTARPFSGNERDDRRNRALELRYTLVELLSTLEFFPTVRKRIPLYQILDEGVSQYLGRSSGLQRYLQGDADGIISTKGVDRAIDKCLAANL